MYLESNKEGTACWRISSHIIFWASCPLDSTAGGSQAAARRGRGENQLSLSPLRSSVFSKRGCSLRRVQVTEPSTAFQTLNINGEALSDFRERQRNGTSDVREPNALHRSGLREASAYACARRRRRSAHVPSRTLGPVRRAQGLKESGDCVRVPSAASQSPARTGPTPRCLGARHSEGARASGGSAAEGRSAGLRPGAGLRSAPSRLLALRSSWTRSRCREVPPFHFAAWGE